MSETPEKPQGIPYGRMLRALRIGGRKTQREIATEARIAPSTYGNIEAYPHRVVSRVKVERILDVLGAPDATRAEVLAAFDAAPTSAWTDKMRQTWERRREERKRARQTGPLERALVRYLVFRLGEGDACDCVLEADGENESGAFTCELCESVAAVGLVPWRARTGDVTSIRAELAEELERRAAILGAANEAPPVDSAVNNDAVDGEGEFG